VGSPPGEEKGETDSLEDTGNSTDGDGVERSLLSEDLGNELDSDQHLFFHPPRDMRTYRWSRGSKEDQRSQVCGTLV
jgi:hypothetical protein